MADRKQETDNFDKEFRLEKKTKSAARGKLPSWIMILAGAAVIGGVVAARQPAVRPVENGTRSSANVSDNVVVADPAGYTGMNDTKADSSELEAFFGVQNSGAAYPGEAKIFYTADDQPYAMNIQPLELDDKGFIIPPDDTDIDGTVYWMDGKPYGVTVQPSETGGNNDGHAEKPIYTIGDKDYEVQLEELSNEEAAALSENEQAGILQIGKESYRLTLKPADQTAETPTENGAESASETPVQNAETDPEKNGEKEHTASAESTPAVSEPAVAAADEPSAVSEPTALPTVPSDPVITGPAGMPQKPEQAPTVKPDEDPFDKPVEEAEPPVIAWANDKPYAVAVKPAEAAENTASEKPAGNEEKESDHAMVFELDGKAYEVQMTEADPSGLSAEDTHDPIVWADHTPLEISINAPEGDEDPDGELEVILNPVPEEKLPALLKERFGEDVSLPATPEPTVEIVPTATVPEPTAEPQKQGWFESLFNNIFGGSPTAEPTPQVTVIAMTPEPTAAVPEPTPIVLRITAPETVPEGPVRLDVPEGSETTGKGLSPKDAEDGSDLEDPALLIVDENDEETVPADDDSTRQTDPADDGTASADAVKPAENSDPMIVIRPTRNPDAQRLEPTIVPENEELPHTGMAEGWNIPSMLALFAGLLLVIIGIRRFRSRE